MTGEPCNGKLLRTVRRGAHGKGLLVSTSPGAYPTAIPLSGHTGDSFLSRSEGFRMFLKTLPKPSWLLAYKKHKMIC